MTTKDLIQSEIDKLDERYLGELYQVVKDFAQTKAPPRKPSLMSRLKRIQIDAPEDFSINLDSYTSGDKRID